MAGGFIQITMAASGSSNGSINSKISSNARSNVSNNASSNGNGSGSGSGDGKRLLPWWASGILAMGVILALTGLPLIAMLQEAGQLDIGRVLGSTYLQRVVRFSLWQASLSTLLSILLAIPVALALAREPRFRGRSLLINLFSLTLVIPTIVAIYGIVAVYGRTGWLNQALELLSLPTPTFYGLTGILLAHVYFNMPLAVRILLQALDGIPESQWRQAAQLGLRSRAQFLFIEWPGIRQQIPALAVLIFTLCFTSFAIVMTLGGGPRATTIEVAIYQALRFDFDISTAVLLACLQLTICVVLMLLSSLAQTDNSLLFAQLGANTRWRPRDGGHTFNILIIGVAALFVSTPLLALIIASINTKLINVLMQSSTLNALRNTLLVSMCAASFALLLAFALLHSTRHLRVRLQREALGRSWLLTGNVILVLPPLVLGTGLFLLLQRYADVFALALPLVILINSLMALPFVLRILDAPLMRSAVRYDRLVQSLGLQAWSRWKLLDWPVLRRPIGFALAVSATLAAGDLGAIALFGSNRVTTLPLLLYQRMGSYRLDEAAVTAGLLLSLCLLIFWLIQRVVGGRARAGT